MNSQDTIDKDSIVSYLRAYIDRAGSQAQAAKRLDVSAATISDMLNGKHDKISDSMWRRVAAQVMPANLRVVKTANFNTITALCRDCQLHGSMKMMSGASGYGKTTALRDFADNNPNVFYVLALECMNTKELLAELLQAVGIDFYGTKYEMLRKLRNRLLELRNPLIIIDDAGKLRESKLQLVQQIYDLTKDYCGILLSGLDYMYDHLVRGAKKEKMGMPELKRRVGYRQKLKPPTAAEVAAIAQLHGIASADTARLLHRYCKDFGTLTESIQNIKRLPEGHTTDDIEALLSAHAA